MMKKVDQGLASQENVGRDPTVNRGTDRLLEAGAAALEFLTNADLRTGAIAARRHFKLGEELLKATAGNVYLAGMLRVQLDGAKEHFNGAITICRGRRTFSSAREPWTRLLPQHNPSLLLKSLSQAFLTGEFASPLARLVECGSTLKAAAKSPAQEELSRELATETEVFLRNIVQAFNRLASDPWKRSPEERAVKGFSLLEASADKVLRVDATLKTLEILEPLLNQGDERQRGLAGKALLAIVEGRAMPGEGNSSLDLLGFADGPLHTKGGYLKSEDVLMERHINWPTAEQLSAWLPDHPRALDGCFILLRNRSGQASRRFAPKVSAWDAMVVKNIHRPFFEAMVKSDESVLNAIGVGTYAELFTRSYSICSGLEHLSQLKRETFR